MYSLIGPFWISSLVPKLVLIVAKRVLLFFCALVVSKKCRKHSHEVLHLYIGIYCPLSKDSFKAR